MEANNSNTLISYSFDGEKGKKFSVFSKKIMQNTITVYKGWFLFCLPVKS